MAATDVQPSLTREDVDEALHRIRSYVHLTPVVTSETLSAIASAPRPSDESEKPPDTPPRIRLFFKCENLQRVGAFKVRGAFHALSRLSDADRRKGVVTHSSGNHAQAIALAARTFGIKAYIVMPTISTPSKIAATKDYGAEVIFSGSTSTEREAVVEDVIRKTGAILIPPYDHPDIVLGQGTMALEFETQVAEMIRNDPSLDVRFGGGHGGADTSLVTGVESSRRGLDAIVAPCGGGGMLSGIATALSGMSTVVFGAEPSFEGADDARRGLAQKSRIPSVKTLTIADGLRTPVGLLPWTIISDPAKVDGIYAVSEQEIKNAMRLVIERMKLFVEPSAAVGLAAVLYNSDLRRRIASEAGPAGWNIGIVLCGGNTTLEAVAQLFGGDSDEGKREGGLLGADGSTVAENVAG
ncbi:MAG: hypothetical protein M1817_004383 [Caeruleum heppii]|nr:MAG: hypothetical protein M1817_004383 [Caeruleum heppii]